MAPVCDELALECDTCRLAAVRHGELGENTGDMALDGAGADLEVAGNLLVGPAHGQEPEGIDLTARQFAHP